jgi:hypothetical protein
MSRVIALAALLTALSLAKARPAQATEVGQGRNFGVGIFLGDPTGLTGKYFLSPNNAIDFGLSFWTYSRWWGRSCFDTRRGRWVSCSGTRVGLHGDFLWEDTLASGTAKLDWHIGVGGRFWVWDEYDYYDDDGDFALAVRVPLGLDLTFRRPHFLELFFELAPAFYIIPGMGFDLEGGIGVRFYF